MNSKSPMVTAIRAIRREVDAMIAQLGIAGPDLPERLSRELDKTEFPRYGKARAGAVEAVAYLLNEITEALEPMAMEIDESLAKLRRYAPKATGPRRQRAAA